MIRILLVIFCIFIFYLACKKPSCDDKIKDGLVLSQFQMEFLKTDQKTREFKASTVDEFGFVNPYDTLNIEYRWDTSSGVMMNFSNCGGTRIHNGKLNFYSDEESYLQNYGQPQRLYSSIFLTNERITSEEQIGEKYIPQFFRLLDDSVSVLGKKYYKVYYQSNNEFTQGELWFVKGIGLISLKEDNNLYELMP